MEAWVWSADWGLASADFSCLSMMAYAKFSGAPLNVKDTNAPFWSPNGKLPVFRHVGSSDNTENFKNISVTLTNFKPFVDHLRKNKFSADYNLTPKESSEAVAFAQLMEEKLLPAILYAFWIDAKNFTEFTRRWYAKKLGLPQCFYYPARYATHATDVVESRVGTAATGEDAQSPGVEAAIYREAQECLTNLSRRLGEKAPYFFGKAPSSADALMYGYLAVILKAPLPNPTPLQAHIKACGNLVSFVSRITNNYFPQAFLDYEKVKKESARNSSKRSETEGSYGEHEYDSGHCEESPQIKKSLFEKSRPIRVVCFAISVMMGFGHFSGVFEQIFGDLIPKKKEKGRNAVQSLGIVD